MDLGLDVQHVSNSIMSLQDKITIALEYVDKVLTGKVPGDKKIGRYLLDTISAVPKVGWPLSPRCNRNFWHLLPF